MLHQKIRVTMLNISSDRMLKKVDSEKIQSYSILKNRPHITFPTLIGIIRSQRLLVAGGRGVQYREGQTGPTAAFENYGILWAQREANWASKKNVRSDVSIIFIMGILLMARCFGSQSSNLLNQARLKVLRARDDHIQVSTWNNCFFLMTWRTRHCLMIWDSRSFLGKLVVVWAELLKISNGMRAWCEVWYWRYVWQPRILFPFESDYLP